MFEYTEGNKVRLKNASVRLLCPEFVSALGWHSDLAEIFATRRFEWPPSAAGVAVPYLGNLLFWIKVRGRKVLNCLCFLKQRKNCQSTTIHAFGAYLQYFLTAPLKHMVKT